MGRIRSVYDDAKGHSVADILSNGPQYVRRKLRLSLRRRYHRRNLHGNPRQIAERRRGALERLRNGGTILFLCHGNICRSPFAARYTEQQLEARGLSGISVESAGLRDQPDRRSPPNARTAATRRGVALDENYSTQADAALLERADLILLKDYRNYHDFTTRFPTAADRMFLLGIFDDDAAVAIDDPYGDSLAAFETSYDRIIASVDALLDAFESRVEHTPRAGNDE